MNAKYLKLAFAGLAVMGLSSCLEFDNPSDEFSGGDKKVDPVVYTGNADMLDYKKEITQEGLNKALIEMEPIYMQFISAQFYVMGGKNGEQPGEHQWQYVYNLTLDNYAGYTTCTQSWNGQLETTYSDFPGFTDGPYGRFTSVKNELGNLLNKAETDSIVELKAMGLLLFDLVAQEVTDTYGSVPYVDYKNNVQSNPFTFNKGVDTYATIIKNIDDIVAVFENYPNRPQWYRDIVDGLIMQYDVLTTTKNLETWRRMANSLKLRMAMRLVKVMPEEAKKWAEEAVASGVVEGHDHEVHLGLDTDYFRNHPLVIIQQSWNDSRINASFESMLFSLDHPYTKYMMGNNVGKIVNGANSKEFEPEGSRVIGLRAGLRMIPGQTVDSNPRCAYSRFEGDNFDFMPIYTLKWAEVDFLRAEGAIRGWNMGGDAKTFYERGIRNADCADLTGMGTEERHYTKYVDDYMKLENAKDYTYIDPADHNNDCPSVTKIGVKWNDADPLEVKLEKIITQKYIAVFPNSYEAWSEMRRTGYPKIFPVLNSEMGDGSLANGALIRRILFPGRKLAAGVEDIANSGLEALGGPDQQATRVFWDIPGANF